MFWDVDLYLMKWKWIACQNYVDAILYIASRYIARDKVCLFLIATCKLVKIYKNKRVRVINRHKIYFDLVLNFLGHSKTPLHYPRKIKFTRDHNELWQNWNELLTKNSITNDNLIYLYFNLQNMFLLYFIINNDADIRFVLYFTFKKDS